MPSVDPDFRDGAKNAIRQFEKDGEQLKYMMLTPLGELSQGDILSSVPFSFFDDDGTQKIFVSDAMVISTSCHIDNKDKLTLAPVLPIDKFTGPISELKSNCIFDYMYIPDGVMSDKFVSFELINSYSKALIFEGLNSNKIQRIGSLNQLGYYFFVVKLTVFFMKLEDNETLTARGVGFNF
ncbi:hypothetical protein [Butyrivibrio sp. VCB2006]|uniref:hypothetical protein n=1 Tax=Butyrivibrio sp. VCB2006 TaxID=1280679 RepID=UPI0012DE1086|nr:hypothetical protein [Butyrivibrio sp. VCB2006]